MKRLIPVFLLAALMLTSCGGGNESSNEISGTVESETTAAAVTTDTETHSAAPISDGRTEQTAASASSAAESTTIFGSGDRSETPAGGSFSVIRPGETTAEDDHIIIITVPADSPAGNDTGSIIVNDDGSLLLPFVQNSDTD